MIYDYRENMDAGALAAWDRLVQKYGDLSVTSAYRSPERNAQVGGAKHSQHLGGKAFDISTGGMSQEQRQALISEARASGFQGIGVYDGSLHFDVGPSRAWGADYTRNSLPEWAGGPVSAPIGDPQNALPQAPAQQNALSQQFIQQQNALSQYQPQQIDVRNFLTQNQPQQRLRFT